jgi:uncharacterized membrane protein YbaN (DUF454 family)
MRIVFFCLGCLMLALGIIGAILPVMPTTIFLIFAVWFFGRSSPRLEQWLLNHPRFGPSLQRWRDYGAIPRKAKIMAVAGMAFGYVVFWIGAKPGPWLAAGVAVFMIGSAIYVVSRPTFNEKS